MDDGPPDQAQGPPALGVVAGGRVAAGELTRVGPPERDVVLRTYRQELVEVSLSVPEAGLQALGARGAEEGGLGLGDPDATDFIGEGCRMSVETVEATASAGELGSGVSTHSH